MKTTVKQRLLARIPDPDLISFVNHFDDVKWGDAFHSAKIQENSINSNRILLVMRGSDITFKKLARKLSELQFPESKLVEIENRYYSAGDICFAIEKSEEGIDLRIYFEIKYSKSNWYKVKSERMKTKDYYTMPLFVGYKWLHHEPKVLVSHYNYIQHMNGNQLIERLKQISNYVPSCVEKQLKDKSIDEVLNYVVMEVKDSKSNRFSYDVRFLKGMLSIKDFSEKDLVNKFKINYNTISSSFANLSIGHVAGGKNKNGDEFLTLYFVV